jgi:hypothetical protein
VSISNDVVTGFPQPGLSRRARKQKEKERKHRNPADTRGKGKAREPSPPPNSNSEGDDSVDDSAEDSTDTDHQGDSGSDKASSGPTQSTSQPLPPPPSQDPPTPEQQSKAQAEPEMDEAQMMAWDKLFSAINEALQIASMILERLNPDLAMQYYKLSESLKADKKKYGQFLSLNECCLPGVAVHFNMAPGDKDFHLDGMSMYLGWVGVVFPL